MKWTEHRDGQTARPMPNNSAVRTLPINGGSLTGVAALVRLILLWILNLFFLFFFLFPFYWQTVTALKPSSELYAQPVRGFPAIWISAHFQNVFTSFGFGQNILNSMIVATATTICVAFAGHVCRVCPGQAAAPGQTNDPGAGDRDGDLPRHRAGGLALHLLRDLQLIDTYWALIIPYVAFSLPFAIWVLTNFFRDIPRDLAEQAEVDGCTPCPVALPGDPAPVGACPGDRRAAHLHRRLE